jgi:DNA-binding CsgD family transcriptional regulator
MLNFNDHSLSKKLPAFNLIAEMNELCSPFFQSFGANYIDYNRIYEDNSLLTLTSDGEWLEHFLKRRYKFCTAFKRAGMHLWDSYYYQLAVHDAKVNFNHDHGITIINQQANYIEYFDIAAPQHHREITSLYLNNFDRIESFIKDFNEKSLRLIKICEKKLIKIPNALCSPDDVVADNTHTATKNIAISNREKQCLEFYLAGNTAKETAEILQLSPRTVEEYINNLKNKFKCKHKRDLLKVCNKKSHDLSQIIL